jgi:hypothetical protein
LIAGWNIGQAQADSESEITAKVKVESLADRLIELQKTYDKFRAMSGKQMDDVWSQLFFYAEYQLDGQMKEDRYDCSSANWKFDRTLGSNSVFEDTEHIEMRLKRVTAPRRSVKTVKPGDIIIFKRTGKYGHIGRAVKINKNVITYVDMNRKDDGPGRNVIEFKDKRIQAVYPVTFDYWAGDILSEIR